LSVNGTEESKRTRLLAVPFALKMTIFRFTPPQAARTDRRARRRVHTRLIAPSPGV
jgi:hypothetical protein